MTVVCRKARCPAGGTAASPLVYGVTIDHFGTYTPALVAAAALLLVSALFFLMLPRFRTIEGMEHQVQQEPGSSTKEISVRS